MQKIMFNNQYGLTRAAIDGTKTNTRRGCKDMSTGEPILSADVVSWRFYPDENLVEFIMTDGSVKVAVPQYKVGEVVAIAQSYKDVLEQMIDAKGGYGEEENAFFELYKDTPGWNNKMFVKADLMPHRIRITDIKVERLQDISDEDCLKEGIFDTMSNRIYHYKYPNSPRNYINPSEAFAALIDKVSGRGTWKRNPWVFAYSYELVK